jgi:hypothetical protein
MKGRKILVAGVQNENQLNERFRVLLCPGQSWLIRGRRSRSTIGETALKEAVGCKIEIGLDGEMVD